MIGGVDVRIPTSAGRQAMEVAVRAVRQAWPRSVFENGRTGDRYDRFQQIPFGRMEELFVYRDADAENRWNEKGAVPELANTMIHLLHDQGLITVVIDNHDEEVDAILGAIRSGLNDSIHAIRGRVAA